jgi:hypothetical protein
MFKRALQSNHWMAIGLDKWNDLENMDLPLKKQFRDPQEGDLDDANEAGSDIVLSGDEEIPTDSDSGSDASGEGLDEEALPEHVVRAEQFLVCTVCQRKKCLTMSDMEIHLQSKKHFLKLEKLAQRSIAVDPSQPDAVELEAPAEPKQVKIPNESNRKARRKDLQAEREDTNVGSNRVPTEGSYHTESPGALTPETSEKKKKSKKPKLD